MWLFAQLHDQSSLYDLTLEDVSDRLLVFSGGFISMHADLLIHGSAPNLSARRRCGLTWSFLFFFLSNAAAHPLTSNSNINGRFSIDIQRFSGAILPSFCIFNRIFGHNWHLYCNSLYYVTVQAVETARGILGSCSLPLHGVVRIFHWKHIEIWPACGIARRILARWAATRTRGGEYTSNPAKSRHIFWFGVFLKNCLRQGHVLRRL